MSARKTAPAGDDSDNSCIRGSPTDRFDRRVASSSIVGHARGCERVASKSAKEASVSRFLVIRKASIVRQKVRAIDHNLPGRNWLPIHADLGNFANRYGFGTCHWLLGNGSPKTHSESSSIVCFRVSDFRSSYPSCVHSCDRYQSKSDVRTSTKA